MVEQLNLTLPDGMRAELRERNLNPHTIAKKALEQALGTEESIEDLIKEEEEIAVKWAETFSRLYHTIQEKMKKRDELVIKEVNKVEKTWLRIQQLMRSPMQACEKIPEIRELTFEDVYDWKKMNDIIDKYPHLLQGLIGQYQMRQYVFYKEVEKGTFKDFQAASEKFRKGRDERIQQVAQETKEWLASDDFKKKRALALEEAGMKGNAEALEELKKLRGSLE